jgi:hypothetical protein
MRTYTPFRLLTGDVSLVLQHAFTRWLSRDLAQPAFDFCRHLGLSPAYCECSPGRLTRYLFWSPPPGILGEIRSGRPKDKFEEIDNATRDKPWRLLSLHISDDGLYSAVWISTEHYETAKAWLAAHGVATAEVHDA